MNLLDSYIISPFSSPNITLVCFFPLVSNYAYVMAHVTYKGTRISGTDSNVTNTGHPGN